MLFFTDYSKLLMIIMNSIDMPMVDSLPQPFELVLAGIIIEMIIDGFCRLFGIFNHVIKG